MKEEERKKRETAETKMNIALIEQKLAESAKTAENNINVPSNIISKYHSFLKSFV